MDAAPPLRLSVPEQCSLFPAEADGQGAVAPKDDGEGGGRDANLDTAALIAGLEQDPFLRFTARVHLALAVYARWSGVVLATCGGLDTISTVAVWSFNGITCTFSTRHMAAYTVAVALWAASLIVQGALARLATISSFVGEPQASAHPLAVLVRWRHLVADGSALVAHVPGDKGCACPRAECAGSLPKQAAFLRALAPIVPLALNILGSLFLFWTLAVTFAPLLWGSAAWTAYFVACLSFIIIIHNVPMHIILVCNTPSTALLRLQGRLRHRAVSLALGGAISRLEGCVADGSTLVVPADEPYVSLHFALAKAWPSELAHMSAGRAGVIAHLCVLAVVGVITASASSCIPLWILFVMLLILAVFVQEMFSIAAANAEIDRIAALYRSSRARILVAIARHPPPAVERALRNHAALLEVFERTEEMQGAFLGFRVRYSVVRGFLATMLTIAVGLWSLLRGAGVSFTAETVCPG
ncbi:hypothetical protein DFJ74DRAFT_710136 [Hyaloraphidium curvatum]|nr:hypothetical protein DFJ74DRAFT_710136 [Hyaloraphidium curvatum]